MGIPTLRQLKLIHPGLSRQFNDQAVQQSGWLGKATAMRVAPKRLDSKFLWD
jgi:hypothetical protein